MPVVFLREKGVLLLLRHALKLLVRWQADLWI